MRFYKNIVIKQKSNMNRKSVPINADAAIIVRSKYFQIPAKKSKRYRSAFSTEQINYLESEFKKFPYIGSANRKEVADILKIPERAIKIWFQNRRMREKRESFVDDKNKINNVNNDQLNTTLNLTLENNEKNINDRLQSCQNDYLTEPEIEIRNPSISIRSISLESKKNYKIVPALKASSNSNRIKPYNIQNSSKIPPSQSPNQTTYFKNFNHTEKQHINEKNMQNISKIPPTQCPNQTTCFKHFNDKEKQHIIEMNMQNTTKISPTQKPNQTMYFKHFNHTEKQHINEKNRPIFSQEKEQVYGKGRRGSISFQSMKASEAAQDLSLGRNKKIQQPFYQVTPNPTTRMVPIYTQNYYAPPVATSMQSNVVWKPVSILPIMPCSPVTIGNSPGFPLNNHEIAKGTCNCHGPPHAFNAQTQCSSRLQPQYILAVPFSNSN